MSDYKWKRVVVLNMKFVTVHSSSLSVGAQICTLNELESKYNQTSLYDQYDEFRGKSTRVNLFDCTTDNKVGTINYEFKGNKFTITASNNQRMVILAMKISMMQSISFLLMCDCPKQAQVIHHTYLNTNDTFYRGNSGWFVCISKYYWCTGTGKESGHGNRQKKQKSDQ